MEIKLNEFKNPSVLEENDLFSNLKELEFIKKELDIRLKVVKNEIKDRFGDKFENDKWHFEMKEIESKRLDSKMIKDLIGDNQRYYNISKSQRMVVRLKK